MVDRPTSLPGTLTLITDSSEKQMNIALDIPEQTIYLVGYRIEMADAATALTKKVIYLDISGGVFNANKMLDNNYGLIYFPIFLDNLAVTLQTGLRIPISIPKPIRETFNIRLLDSTFSPLVDTTEFIHGSFQFEIEKGHIT